MREDKPLESPSLIELSAHVVASNDNMYKYSQYYTPACNSTDSSECVSPMTTCSSSPNSSNSFLNMPLYKARHFYRAKSFSKEEETELFSIKTIELPINASEMVFKFICQNLKQTEDKNNSVNIIPAAKQDCVTHALRPFTVRYFFIIFMPFFLNVLINYFNNFFL